MFWLALLLPLASSVRPPLNKAKIVSKNRIPVGFKAAPTAQAVVSTENDIEKKVFYGSQVQLGTVPFVVLLLTNIGDGYRTICGGSILSEYWILTAAHCVEENAYICSKCDSTSNVMTMHTNTITAGDKTMDEQEGPEQKVYPKQIFVHSEYDSLSLTYDIALIRLESPIVYNRYISNITISSSLPNTGTTVSVAGWGDTEDGDSKVLRNISYEFPTVTACINRYGSILKESMWCTGTGEVYHRAGVGDSGGPVYHQIDDLFYLDGLVSWGTQEPMQAGDYDVNTNIPFLYSWILNIQNNYARIELPVNGSTNILYWNNNATRYTHQPFTLTCITSNCKIQIQLTSFDFSKDDGTQLMIHDGGTLQSPYIAVIHAHSEGTLIYTSTTSDLTLVIATGDKDKLVSFNASYKAVTRAGNNEEQCGPVDITSYYNVCDNGQLCYQVSYKCDEYNDCRDYTDELDCKYRSNTSDSDTAVGCYNRDFKCNNRRCVRDKFVCDGYNDCSDYSDEKYSTCDGSCVGVSVYVVVLAILVHFVLARN